MSYCNIPSGLKMFLMPIIVNAFSILSNTRIFYSKALFTSAWCYDILAGCSYIKMIHFNVQIITGIFLFLCWSMQNLSLPDSVKNYRSNNNICIISNGYSCTSQYYFIRLLTFKIWMALHLQKVIKLAKSNNHIHSNANFIHDLSRTMYKMIIGKTRWPC